MKKKIKRSIWKPPPFRVEVEYKLVDGRNFVERNLDKEICKAAGKSYSAGSGYDFGTGERDLEFDFKRKNSAIAAAKRIKKIRGVKAVVIGRVWP